VPQESARALAHSKTLARPRLPLMHSHPWYLLRSGAGDSAFNMALDEALLHEAPRLRQPVLRFYAWTEPAASFGYFQHYTDIERATHLRPLVRRPTGGGLVPHDADWTYSLAFPPIDAWYALSAIESYRRVHEWIQAALSRIGVSAQLAPACSRSVPGQCFQGYEKHDVLWRGRKIAGAAQRRTRDGLLIQGSVQPTGLGVTRREWETAMCDVARATQDADWAEFKPDAPLTERAQELARQKYSHAQYNQKR
jgi:lipoyl(octanoyl) transferase